MSGFEVVGLITSIITITETLVKVYKCLKDIEDLPREFQDVGNRLPLLGQSLHAAKSGAGSITSDGEADALHTLLVSCEKKTEQLLEIFEKIRDNATERSVKAAYKKLDLRLGKASRVQTLMDEILKDVQVLAAHRAFKPALRAQVSALGEARKTLVLVERQERIKAMLKKLEYKDLNERKDRNPERIEGTCHWFVTHPIFRDWRESQASRLLWVSANPGCGKSVLARYLVDKVLPTSAGGRTTCYFFFKDSPDQKSVTIALRSILHQFFQQKPNLLSDDILDRNDDDKDFATSFRALWDVLTAAAEDETAGDIVCILDAIDECERSGWTQLARSLCKFYSTVKTGSSRLKFLLTSRPYVEIGQDFQPLEIPDLPTIHLTGEGDAAMKLISREIDIFIVARTKALQARLKLEPDELTFLQEKLTSNPNRTYLWVHLTLDLIKRHIIIDKAGIRKATSHLPREVYEAYEQLLARSPDRTEAKKLLHMIVAAERPLTLREMALASAVGAHGSYDALKHELLGPERFRDHLLHLCGLLVIIEDSKIYLLHQTAKEFLVRPESGDVPGDGSSGKKFEWKHSLRLRDSHRILADVCIRHLYFSEFETQPLDENTPVAQYVDGHLFLGYSARYWTTHFREAHINSNAIIQSALGLCDANSKRCQTWLRVYWGSTNMEFPAKFTSLMIGSYFGIAAAVSVLLKVDNIDLNARDDTYGRTALSWAAGNGLPGVCKLLIKGSGNRFKGYFKQILKLGAEVDLLDWHRRTALSYAVWNGHKAVVELLVKNRAQVSVEDQNGGTPLSYAVCNGREDIIQLLLKGDTKVDSEDMIRRLLVSGARNGDMAVVQLLLEKNADLETKDTEYGRTPLSWAARNGHEAVVKVLLEKNADLETKDTKYGRTPLSWAAENGHEAVVKVLLEKNADLETKDTKFGRTPLSWAAENGHEAVVKVLLEKNADLGTKDTEYGRTPLSWAAKNGHEAVVKVLQCLQTLEGHSGWVRSLPSPQMASGWHRVQAIGPSRSGIPPLSRFFLKRMPSLGIYRLGAVQNVKSYHDSIGI
ncbi:hypothetical protein QBC37DRAFT_35880 [Rhypophila decipiens]|uniref:Uncharacterized protein n=1 Tax=Rhypophila decipiens TaxID=261697 RepID=A0AAN6Y0D5_9PEZI|nr:hypothetical protein QBC37DRAFT_35880 [Rhypophila decipiens]